MPGEDRFGTQAMIISASRRTDIPALYAQWFINRIRAGYWGVLDLINRSVRVKDLNF